MLSRRDRPISKKAILENSGASSRDFKRGYASSPKLASGYSCNFKRSAPPTKKASSREFKKGYANSLKRVISFTKFKKTYAPSPKRLFQEIQGGIFSKKSYSREFKKGCATLNKKTSSMEFKRGYAPPSKRAIPGNSRMYIFPF